MDGLAMNLPRSHIAFGRSSCICSGDGCSATLFPRPCSATNKFSCLTLHWMRATLPMGTPARYPLAACSTASSAGQCFLHPSCQIWIQGLVPEQMHGALKGRNLEAGIVNLLEQWRHSDSVLLSLDLRKGFDYADANHSLKVLEHYGFCDEWLRYLTGVWERQLRVSQIGPYVTSVPEVAQFTTRRPAPLWRSACCWCQPPWRPRKATALPRPSLWTTAT